jgi:hypothetical protein
LILFKVINVCYFGAKIEINFYFCKFF